MREIKFRAWDGRFNQFVYFNALSGLHSLEPKAPIMQHTDLKDANGVEIYEGDIVIDTDNLPDEQYLSKVVFDTDCGMWVIKDLNGDCEQLSEWNVEIIGNIHENPELLS